MNILAERKTVVQDSTKNAEQMVKDSGRRPASSNVAVVYSALLSGFWSLSAEKSRTFNIVGAQIDTEQCSHLLSGSVV